MSQSIMMETFPPQQQGTGQAIFGIGAMLGPSLGPTLGGWITDQLVVAVDLLRQHSARACSPHFCAGATCPSRRAGAAARRQRVDWLGIVLLVVGIGALQTFLERGNRLDWFESDLIIAPRAASPRSSSSLFVWHELRVEHPIVDLRVLRHRALVVGCVYGALIGVGLYGSVFLFPLFTQQVLRWTSWQSGLAIPPSSLATAITMPVAGRLVWRARPARRSSRSASRCSSRRSGA